MYILEQLETGTLLWLVCVRPCDVLTSTATLDGSTTLNPNIGLQLVRQGGDEVLPPGKLPARPLGGDFKDAGSFGLRAPPPVRASPLGGRGAVHLAAGEYTISTCYMYP